MPHPLISPGRNAFVTGGASGIGLAIARRFVAAGMRVALADRDEAALQAAFDALDEAAGGSGCVMALPLDVADRAAVEAAAAAVFGAWEKLHVLINNAGIGPASSALDPAN